MRLKKHEKEVLKAIKFIWPDMQTKILPASKHPQLIATYTGKAIIVSVASSPSCADTVPSRTIQLIRRRFKSIGIGLPASRRGTSRH